MKKILIPCVAIFFLLCICLVVFQINNPPPPEVRHDYTEHKVSSLLFEYADDKQTQASAETSDITTEKLELPPVVFGIMIEQRIDGDIFEYYFSDVLGHTEHALSTETEKTVLVTGDERTFDIDSEGFSIPTKYDFDTPEGDEIKVYLNTSKGARLKSLTVSEFENSEYKAILEEMISNYKGAETK